MAQKTTSRTRSTTRARSRWNEAAARDVIEQFQASGKTVAAFAGDRGLNAWTLYEWRRRLGMCPAKRGSTLHESGARVAARHVARSLLSG